MSPHPRRALLDDAATGKFPPADGLIDVVPSPGGLADAIVGLTGHFMGAVAQAAAGLVPAGEPSWAQVAPGNAASLRTLGAAGFVPVGAEVLFPRSTA